MSNRLRVLSFSLFFVLFSTSMFAQWVAQTSGTTNRQRYIHAVNSQILWACGNAGEVLKTTNGGTTWTKSVTLATATNYMVQAFDATTAWVTGTVGGSADVSIWKTTDGGTTWVSKFNNPAGFGDGLIMFDANNGVYWGDPDPWPSAWWEIYTTSDAGNTWARVQRNNVPPCDSVNGEYGAAIGMSAVGNNVWFIGYSSVAGTNNSVWKSTNKGLTWTKSGSFANGTAASGSAYIAMNDANNGVIVTLAGNVTRTTDGGTTWTPTTTVTGAAFRHIVNLKGTNRYVAVGSAGTSYLSDNGGLTWTPITPLATTNALYSVTEYGAVPFAAGNAGIIWKWGGSPLPVEFTAFSTSVSQNEVTLNWTTASEKNNRGFEVERKSADGEFILRGFIEGAGTSLDAKNYTFTDKEVVAGKYTYRLKQIDFDGHAAYSDEVEVDVTTPDNFELGQNYPNPFNPSTTINYQIKFDGHVSLKVYDYTGNQVADLVNQNQVSGKYTVQFNAAGLSSGIYFYTISAPGFTATKKLTLLK